jgi:hypothetical protein
MFIGYYKSNNNIKQNLNMSDKWEIIFQYQLGISGNAQIVYDKIFKAALTYKFKDVKGFAVPVDNKVLTESIFGLTSHDKIEIERRIINGQKIKELFITSIVLKWIESKFEKGDYFFIVITENETSCDTAVMVAKKDSVLRPIDEKQLMFPEEHFPFEFQVKEYFDFKRMKEDPLLISKEIDIKKMEKIVKQYSEITLIYVRDYIDYESDKMIDFFEKHKDCYLISSPAQIKKDGKEIPLNYDKNNYIITLPQQAMVIESFDKPSFLLKEKPLESI